MKLPCPIYYNPADYGKQCRFLNIVPPLFSFSQYTFIKYIKSILTVIELACGEYGEEQLKTLIIGSENGRKEQWFENPQSLKDAKALRGIIIFVKSITINLIHVYEVRKLFYDWTFTALHPLKKQKKVDSISGSQATPLIYQISVLLKKGFLICKRDQVKIFEKIFFLFIIEILSIKTFVHT